MNVASGPDGNAQYRIRGRRFVPAELAEELFKVAECDRDLTDPAQPSEAYVLIRADRRLPWREVQPILDACRDPDVRIYKVQFAVVPP